MLKYVEISIQKITVSQPSVLGHVCHGHGRWCRPPVISRVELRVSQTPGWSYAFRIDQILVMLGMLS
jgi:hypothetical protein